MKKIASSLLMVAVTVLSVTAQDFPDIFSEFAQQANHDFQSFADKANNEYVKFLRKSWEWFEGKAPVAPPVKDEPVVPPVHVPEEQLGKDVEDRELPYGEIVPKPDSVPAPTPIAPIDEIPVPVIKTVAFELYGTDCHVRFDRDKRPYMENVTEKAIADFWEILANCDDIDNMLYDIYAQRESLSLCDWAYYKYVRAFCHALYPDDSEEAGVLHSFIMTQSGFQLKIGIDSYGHVYPLMAVECALYAYPYFEVNGQEYYVLEKTDSETMKIIEDAFPATVHPMRMSIEHENLFAERLSTERILASERYPEATVSIMSNLNLISFFDEYPLAFLNDDLRTKWRFYANVPSSHNMREQIYPVLRRAIAGKSEIHAANILLNFVQTAFEYEYDENIWGGDRSFFADESVYYPYCDCEDRSILFSRLVRDLMGLEVVLLYYPGHLAAAVQFNESVSGDYIRYDNCRYTICDPTYINAPVGMTIPGMDNASAFVVVL